jgi:HEPN domain-containing protein
MDKLTAQWVGKAEADYRGMRRLRKAKPPLHDLVCFHGQQAAEKYMKALMQALGLTITKTHDLDLLRASLATHHPSLSTLRRGLVYLTQFAVETRYPGKKVQKRQADAAARWTARVRTAARTLLGL